MITQSVHTTIHGHMLRFFGKFVNEGACCRKMRDYSNGNVSQKDFTSCAINRVVLADIFTCFFMSALSIMIGYVIGTWAVGLVFWLLFDVGFFDLDNIDPSFCITIILTVVVGVVAGVYALYKAYGWTNSKLANSNSRQLALISEGVDALHDKVCTKFSLVSEIGGTYGVAVSMEHANRNEWVITPAQWDAYNVAKIHAVYTQFFKDNPDVELLYNVTIDSTYNWETGEVERKCRHGWFTNRYEFEGDEQDEDTDAA